MLEAFRGSDNPPAVITWAGCAPAVALFDGRSLHGYKVPLGTVSRSRCSRFALPLASYLFLERITQALFFIHQTPLQPLVDAGCR